ncbi:DUF1709-domain-containing protein [Teratosphaeria nubilosa]|uniref:DUF1709-domain-containing protein n=1 Tax=Teratosphaeria nubilosa TaxID=161662 RepID=A0A6G1L2R5_9PEZI|nr:DUF1709-domain-containing protein [Teratosphaeria nubilosa]
MDSVVSPLRISKNSSPNKAAMASSKPLADISSTSQRRNSPSYNQATRKMIVSGDTSPYAENSSPFQEKASPRAFWSSRETMSPSRFDENSPERSPSPLPSTPKRRPSVEKLKQASRVKNSNIFALENKDAYDPTSLPIVERPSANRPRSAQLLNSPFTRYDSLRKENHPILSPRPTSGRTESKMSMPTMSPSKEAQNVALPASPEKQTSPSPTKSSMARNSMFGTSFDPDQGTWSDDEGVLTPRALHRHNKSVTFHADPPTVTEYEQQTPEPSVSVDSREGSWDSDEFEDQDISFERGSSADLSHQDGYDSYDEDLEDTDKTPVVLPEDWSRMSPDEARTDLVNREDDVFDSTPSPSPQRSGSDSRPLPPLPGLGSAKKARNSMSADDILNMRRKLSVEENERPSSKDSNGTAHGMPEELTITNLDTGEKMDVQVRVAEAAVVDDSVVADLDDFASAPPRISRESILRNVRENRYDYEEGDEIDGSVFEDSPARPSLAEMARMDPDQPIPSRENSRETSETPMDSPGEEVEAEVLDEVQVKPEPGEDDDGINLNDIPAIDDALLGPPRSPSHQEDYDRQSSVLHHPRSSSVEQDDDESQYSEIEPEGEGTVFHAQEPDEDDGKETLQDAMQLLTVKDYSEPQTATQALHNKISGSFTGLPSYLANDDYDFGMGQYMVTTPPASNENTTKLSLENAPRLQPAAEFAVAPEAPRDPYDATHREVSPPGTPESVLHHESEHSSAHWSEESEVTEEPATEQAPAPATVPEVPERRSTIKTNGQLRARPSATPADFATMAEQRRTVSLQLPVPPISDQYQARTASAEGEAGGDERSVHSAADSSKVDSSVEEDMPKRRESRRMKLEVPLATSEADDLSLGLDQEFDRVIESQKKGYLMRQNTKLVVATNRNFSDDSAASKTSSESAPSAKVPRPRSSRSANSSPRKGSAEQFLKTEPWNGKSRRESSRKASVQKALSSQPAPPLPGQPSALDPVNEDVTTASFDDDVDEGVERGRLFVKVIGVKELDLPMPRNDRIYFQLTLDNGLHCVTTTSLELGRQAPIGQEFELVVLNDLEFQLTLTTKLPPPPKAAPPTTRPSTPSHKKANSKSSLSRFLSSPKKRAEKERLEREAAEAEERRFHDEERRKRASVMPTAWDMLRELVNAQDGSFARSYVNLKSHEKQCFGRPLVVDVPCYNEWALEKDSHVVNSVRSKRGPNAGPVRRPPYVVGKLELQLLYVPKPRGATDDEMPRSMSSAIREMNKAAEVVEVVHEGHLSQQGGDCAHWRRRFFRLQGSRLTAYHEHTLQKRAVINLSKASRLVDDKSTLVADPNSKQSGKARRKSAFAEEDEGYQYVEEGFRIRFANGETIDFYADSRAKKDNWMGALSQVIGKPATEKKAATWTDLVLAREKAEGLQSRPSSRSKEHIAGGTDVKDFTRPPASLAPSSSVSRKAVPSRDTSKSAPTSPLKGPPTSRPPLPPVARPRTPPMAPRSGHRSRDAVKSMIF